ncbi:MAG: hypothetical protein ABI091_27175 [Ferruginibacter sp.]
MAKNKYTSFNGVPKIITVIKDKELEDWQSRRLFKQLKATIST